MAMFLGLLCVVAERVRDSAWLPPTFEGAMALLGQMLALVVIVSIVEAWQRTISRPECMCRRCRAAFDRSAGRRPG